MSREKLLIVIMGALIGLLIGTLLSHMQVEHILVPVMRPSGHRRDLPGLHSSWAKEVDARELGRDVAGKSSSAATRTRPLPLQPTTRTSVHQLNGPTDQKLVAKPDQTPVDLADLDPSRFFPSRALLDPVADGANMIMMTFVTGGYYTFLDNWIAQVRRAGLTNFVVGTVDLECLRHMVARSIPAVFARNQTAKLPEHSRWGSPNFKRIVMDRIQLTHEMLDLGYTVIFSDLDVVWLRDPRPFFGRFPSADLLISSDAISPEAREKDGEHLIEAWRSTWQFWNIGLVLMRPSMARFVEDWYAHMRAHPELMAQQAFYQRIRDGMQPNKAVRDVFPVWNAQLLAGVLPVSYFAGGHLVWASGFIEKYGVRPYAVHATFCSSGLEGKIQRFRERMIWNDPPEYYEPSEGVLYIDNIPPPDLLANSGPGDRPLTLEGTVGHFRLVHHQLREIRSAFQLAEITNRTLVMPQLYCGLDTWWNPHNGSIEEDGREFLPFKCPMDHVFNIFVWNFYKIKFRESTFLENPNLPPRFNNSRAVVRACGDTDPACPTRPLGLSSPGLLHIVRSGQEEAALEADLRQLADYKVLKVENPTDVLYLYKNLEKRNKLVSRFSLLCGSWGSVQEQMPGGPRNVWYDPFWDVDHYERTTRFWRAGEWVPILRSHTEPLNYIPHLPELHDTRNWNE